MRKILVVDNGRREEFDSLSQELAGLGLSSVTTSFEAADDVLGLIDRPSAIFVKLPQAGSSPDYDGMVAVAENLKRRESALGVPVIVWDGTGFRNDGMPGILQSQTGPRALRTPEF